MTQTYLTDLQVAQGLETLSDLIQESLERVHQLSEEAKETEEARQLIAEIETSRHHLSAAHQTLQKTEESTLNYLREARSLENRLQDFKQLCDRLAELGISDRTPRQIEAAYQALRKAEQDIRQAQQHFEQISNQIREDLRRIEQMIGVYENKMREGQNIFNQLNAILQAIGSFAELKALLQETQKTRDEILTIQQQAFAVQELQAYLEEFPRMRDRKQLWRWLRRELGMIGVIVYVLHLLSFKGKR
jgi:DNA repair exonuclease SbcCD ATPase subunit